MGKEIEGDIVSRVLRDIFLFNIFVRLFMCLLFTPRVLSLIGIKIKHIESRYQTIVFLIDI